MISGSDMTKSSNLEDTKRLMGALVRMKPKPHGEMKVSKKATSAGRTKKVVKRRK
jgi:hypothetical protein